MNLGTKVFLCGVHYSISPTRRLTKQSHIYPVHAILFPHIGNQHVSKETCTLVSSWALVSMQTEQVCSRFHNSDIAMDNQGYQSFVLATQHVTILKLKVTKEFSRTVLTCLFQHGFVQMMGVWRNLLIFFRKSEPEAKYAIFLHFQRKVKVNLTFLHLQVKMAVVTQRTNMWEEKKETKTKNFWKPISVFINSHL